MPEPTELAVWAHLEAIAHDADIDTGDLVEAVADTVPAHVLQQALTLLAKVYVRKIGQGEAFPPVTDAATATDVVVLCQALLDAADLQVFELGMWAALGDAAQRPSST